jgi:predicted  nucleic acid-binding Zn-ribbon protein
MFFELPQNLVLMTVGAFLLGWILSSISSRMGSATRARKQDPRDARIRSLEAELRIAQQELAQLKENGEQLEQDLAESAAVIEERGKIISHQQRHVEVLKKDLKESVLKTRELRAELSERAEESVRSEVKLREVETELSVAQASTDMIATGVLDISLVPEALDDEVPQPARAPKAGT